MAWFSLDKLVVAVAQADGRKPWQVLDPMSADLAEVMKTRDVGALAGPQALVPEVGTDVRQF